jgi:hypothetical protein
MTPPFTDWSPPALVGISFTFVACLKLYGLRRNIPGGAGKPFTQRCLGYCPTWSKHANLGLIALFLLIGLANLAWLVCMFFAR